MEVTTHQQPVNFFGSQSVGYILLDQNTGAGAYRIGGGENGGLLKGIGYVINTLTYFYGLLDNYAQCAGTKIPGFGKIVQFLQIASFVQALLVSGKECWNYSAVAIIATVSLMLSLIIFDLVLMYTNPLAAFVVSPGVDAAFLWINRQIENCK
jgi:hypothetical protein